MKHIFVIYAHFETKPGNELLVKEIVSTLIDPTRKELGCIKYDVYYSNENPSKIILHEFWKDEKAHDFHMTMPYVQAWQVRKNELLKSFYNIEFYKPIEEINYLIPN